MEAMRTDDSRFDNLPGWNFAPNYVDDLPGYDGLRMHYVDEGPKDADHVFLCIHGQPTWSYLYRKMIPVFLESGARVIAPDYFGFGRSDKPVDDAVYTWDFHRNAMLELVRHLDIKNITLVCQDWGGLIGLTLPVDEGDRFNRLIVMNTTIAVGLPAGKGFDDWRKYVANTPDFDVGKLMKRGTPVLNDVEVAAYDAPFDGPAYKAGVRRFPALVMTDPDMDGVAVSKQAVAFWNSFQGQSFMAIGLQDPVLGEPAMRMLHKQINNCADPMLIEDAGHFVQEWGVPVARAALAYFESAA